MEEDEYKRVSCDFYDQLEIYATHKTKLKIKFLDEEHLPQELSDPIKTLETKNKDEFLITESGRRLRLDKIIELSEEE